MIARRRGSSISDNDPRVVSLTKAIAAENALAAKKAAQKNKRPGFFERHGDAIGVTMGLWGVAGAAVGVFLGGGVLSIPFGLLGLSIGMAAGFVSACVGGLISDKLNANAAKKQQEKSVYPPATLAPAVLNAMTSKPAVSKPAVSKSAVSKSAAPKSAAPKSAAPKSAAPKSAALKPVSQSSQTMFPPLPESTLDDDFVKEMIKIIVDVSFLKINEKNFNQMVDLVFKRQIRIDAYIKRAGQEVLSTRLAQLLEKKEYSRYADPAILLKNEKYSYLAQYLPKASDSSTDELKRPINKQ